MKTFAIVGAGFSGAVIANRIASAMECRILVFDRREHLAGNCHTSRDPATGIMEHHYGPHIFHTSSRKTWDYIRQFSEFRPFVNRVKAVTPRGFFTLPINLTTINQFFGKTFHPEEAREFIAEKGEKQFKDAKNFEEQALFLVGRELYEIFFKGYTIKQWGVHPTELPATILKRLPIRFNCDDNYYNSTFQAIPSDGYTAIVERLMNIEHIEIKQNTNFENSFVGEFDHVFFSGAIDEFYGNVHGRLCSRSVYFEKQRGTGDWQGNPVINHTSQEVPYTRIAEHKHFTPWEEHEKTIVFKEFSKFTAVGDIPSYPMQGKEDKRVLAKYINMAKQEEKVSFLGRLATYRYLDMDAVINEALDFSDEWLSAKAANEKLPIFPNGGRDLPI
ncbi:MAG: NAD(P)-binding protein [Puniceicoccales bacterium]|nr:NAD(P)-binding protein [Puniceicoccales bacterium]